MAWPFASIQVGAGSGGKGGLDLCTAFFLLLELTKTGFAVQERVTVGALVCGDGGDCDRTGIAELQKTIATATNWTLLPRM